MISASGFAKSHSSTWKTLAPTTDLFVKKINAQLLEREFPPLVSTTLPDRRGFINEIAFELFRAAAAAGFNDSQPNINTSIAAAKTHVAQMGDISPEQVADPSAAEIEECLAQGRNIKYFFMIASKGQHLHVSPVFKGCGIIDTCVGDVFCSETLYEVKAGDRSFRSTDVRQLLTYAALNKASNGPKLARIGLFNPRIGVSFSSSLDVVCSEVAGCSPDDLLSEIVRIISSGDVSR